VGPGNNGGDTLIALAALVDSGWSASAYLVTPRPDNDPLVERLRAKSIHIVSVQNDEHYSTLDELISQADVLLDGVLGTGFHLPMRPEIARVLAHVVEQPHHPFTIAVDCPSGVDCDSGEIAPECIPADLTICMAAVKTGLLRLPAFAKIGDLAVVDIGLPQDLPGWKDVRAGLMTSASAAALLPARPLDAHKGTFGTVTVAAGSINFTGAAFLAAKAAYRIGAGLVRLAAPGPLHSALAGLLPEVVWLIMPHELGVIAEAGAELLLKNLATSDALLIGPGFGLEDTTEAFMKRLFSAKAAHPSRGTIGFLAPETPTADSDTSFEMPPLVVDADGLKLLARLPEWPKLLPPHSVLTPHPGEMALLTGLKLGEIQADRLKTAQTYAEQWGHVVVLKGALTVIAAPGEDAMIIPIATPALAHAGTGDVLAGMIAGLLAQGVPAFQAACAGAWVHANAGLEAADYLETTTSVMASDVLDSIPSVLHKLESL
jgi:NAD(P)H-hydrate epimerase